MKRSLLIVLAVVGAITAGLLAYSAANGPSDREQIQTALAEAIRASREGEAGPVLDFVSGKATLNSEGGASRRDISNYIRKAKPDVTFTNPTIKVDGDKAILFGPVQVKFQILTMEQTATLKSATVELEKESATKWGIFPTHKWRVTKIWTDEDLLRELSLQ